MESKRYYQIGSLEVRSDFTKERYNQLMQYLRRKEKRNRKNELRGTNQKI